MKRILSILCIFALALGSLTLSAAAEKPSYLSNEARAVLSETNAQRKAAGKQPYSVFQSGHQAAQARAEELITLFEHTRPNGASWSTVLGEYGIPYFSAGENIAVGYPDAKQVVKAWMESEGHRQNILDEKNYGFKHMAPGYIITPNRGYRYHWSQLFIGGCSTTAIALVSEAKFDPNGRLLNDPMLAITCNLHGAAYLPLADADYSCPAGQYKEGRFTVRHDGMSATLRCSVGFSDVGEGGWFTEGVDFVAERGLMKGNPNGTFAPERTMTRAELITVLYRLAGEPQGAPRAPFSDVSRGSWYEKAVNWATAEEIINGVGGGRFAPEEPITRGQLATILYRYDKDPAPHRASLGGFADGAAAPSWAREALEWAVYEGLINGIPKGSKTYLDFDGSALRAQVALILMRYIR